ncbi:hypothetical protein Scep_005406 [Stephania cephalantha]|uniref:Uncharacterized protein n=1 Tax=Stephania cephalantha TaxID=152367 RepID=A0AAP0KU92_9MAGN
MKPHHIAIAESSSTMVTRENANSITENMNASLPETASPESNDAAGPWIHASRHVRRTKTKITDTGDNKADSQGPSFHNKSRFEVLADENLENLSVNDSSKSKKYGEPNKEVSNGKLLLGQSNKKTATAMTKLPSQKVYKVKDNAEPTRPITTPKQAFIGEPKIINGPSIVAELTLKAQDVVCTSLPANESLPSSSPSLNASLLNASLPLSSSSVTASLPGNASRPSSSSSDNASMPVNASLPPSSSTENASLRSATVLSTSLHSSSPPSTSTNSLLVLPLPSTLKLSTPLLSTSRPSTSPQVDAAIPQIETKPLGDNNSEIVMEEVCQQIETNTMESVCPTLEPTKICLDGEHHTVVVIENKGLTERLGGGYSLPLPRTTNTLGRPPDPSKLINLKGDLKIKRQSAKGKKVLTPYMRDNLLVGNKPSNVDDSCYGVVSDSSVGEL